MDIKTCEESKRLETRDARDGVFPWYKWGPYTSERAWGTVREDYSLNGDAWKYVTYDMAKAKAYTWGEDGLAGFCDRFQILVFSFAFWNGKDRELKERLFGVNPSEGNHGEDVKEYYYYLENTPSHSYMKYLYKYTQHPYPYDRLVNEGRSRGKEERELELVDTGVFHENSYFDIFIEYAKASPEDICIKVEVINRASHAAPIHIIPQIFFRKRDLPNDQQPIISLKKEGQFQALICDDLSIATIKRIPFPYSLGKRYLYSNLEGEPLFTNNDTNNKLLFGKANETPYVKDAFHRYIIHNEKKKINPELKGSKAAFNHKIDSLASGASKVFYFRLSDQLLESPLNDVESIIEKRKKEAFTFYENLHPKGASEDEKMIQRQAVSGLLWNKQFYFFDVDQWLNPEGMDPELKLQREDIRNKHWKHLLSMRILLMPDKWEYPWFAAWDLAFHTIPMALIDSDFAKEQLWLLLFDQFQHPNGQIPAYEWEFSEMNPPVQAWAVLRLYRMEFKKKGIKDFDFLKKCFHKLVMNFTWWVNKVDQSGNNVFEGGFLGLDNITVIDRSMHIPGGGVLEQSDGTGWMGMYSLVMMRMALELAEKDPVYEGTAVKFFEHYVYIASALHACKGREIQIWNEKEGFFYDVLNFSNERQEQILVKSLVGIIPLYALEFLSEEEIEKYKEFKQSFYWFLNHKQNLTNFCITPVDLDGKKTYMLSLMNEDQAKRVLQKVWDPTEFRSEYGLRSLSKIYDKNPYAFLGNSIVYEPGEAIATLKGGNSNWRGPIWFPTTFLLIDSLKRIDEVLGDRFFIEFQGEKITAGAMAKYFAEALIKIFSKDASGRRAVFGDQELMQSHPHWKEYLLFYEHFHADTGRGLGASHQTGWTALIANLIDEWR